MSYSVYVPCNCRLEKKTKYPDFKDKLTIRRGLIDLKEEFLSDIELERRYDKWQFCEHHQIAIEFSMTQVISNWKPSIIEKYPNEFLNFLKFIPNYDGYLNTEYDKQEAILEIKQLNSLEDFKYKERFEQFIKLLETAIELHQEVYW